jgi:hypothetical protein
MPGEQIERAMVRYDPKRLTEPFSTRDARREADIDALLICWDELERRKRRNRRAQAEIRQLMSKIHVGEAQGQGHQHRIGAGPWRLVRQGVTIFKKETFR